MLEAGMHQGQRRKNRLVITIHGIRTYGDWQERLEAITTAQLGKRGLKFVNYKYGYFSTISFLIPFARGVVVKKFREELRRLAAERRWSRIDIVGHSFGTLVIANAVSDLDDHDKFKIDTVILSGSVLPSEFPWHKYIGRRVRTVINDCGSNDSILLLSQLFVFLTGMAGRVGFVGSIGASLRNRYSTFGHSGYFLDAMGKPDSHYMVKHWLPILTTDEPAEFFDLRVPPSPINVFLEKIATYSGLIKFAIYSAPIVVVALVYMNLFTQAQLERDAKEIAAENATYSASKLVYSYFGSKSQGDSNKNPIRSELLLDSKITLDSLNGISKKSEPLRLRGLSAIAIEQSAILRIDGDYKSSEHKAYTAINSLKEVIEKYGSEEDINSDLAVAYDRLSDVQSLMGKITDATDAIQNSVLYFEAPRTETNRSHIRILNLAKAKNKLGKLLIQNGDFTNAGRELKESCSLIERTIKGTTGHTELTIELSRCHRYAGLIAFQANERDKATDLFNKSFSILELSKNSIQILMEKVDFHANLAQLYEDSFSFNKGSRDQGENNNAITTWTHHAREAFDTSHKIILIDSECEDCAFLYISAGINYGLALSGQRMNEQALLLYSKIEETFINNGYEALGFGLNRLRFKTWSAKAQAYEEILDYKNANKYYNRAVELFDYAKSSGASISLWKDDLLEYYRRAASSEFKLTNYAAAARFASKRVALFREHPGALRDTMSKLPEALSELSWYAIFDKNNDGAIAASQEAMSYLSQPIPPNVRWIEINYGHSLLAAGRDEEARVIYQKNVSTARDDGHDAERRMRDLIRDDLKAIAPNIGCKSVMAEFEGDSFSCGTQ